jgi:hypothetical protein
VLARISGSVWPRRERRFMSNHSGIAAVQRGARRFSTHHAVQQRCRGKALACSAGRRCSSAGLRMCRRVNCKRRGTACSAGRRCSSAGLRMCRRVNCKRRGTACSAGRRCSSAGLRMCRRVNCKRRGTACSAGRRCSSAGLRMCRRVCGVRRGALQRRPIGKLSGCTRTEPVLTQKIIVTDRNMF